MLYERNDIDFKRGSFRVRGDVIEIIPTSVHDKGIRIEFFGDEIDKISEFDVVTGRVFVNKKTISIFPASFFVTSEETLKKAVSSIKEELKERLEELNNENKLVEAQRLEQRTNYDIEMMLETGFCTGIENYSRHLGGRKKGETPTTLMDFFPKDYLLVVDESHVTLPHVSATPGDYELDQAGSYVEQIIRPTGLLDPTFEVRKTKGQIDDLVGEINERISKNERVLITTLTIRMAEELTAYLKNLDIKVAYLHSEIKSLDRLNIIRELRLGTYDCIVGINLLREGLDIPEVSLIAILDADKEGFLRSKRSLIQTMGRCARNANGHVIMYADTITESMKLAMEETKRRRSIQEEYNKKHNIVPKTIIKEIRDNISNVDKTNLEKNSKNDIISVESIEDIEKEMKEAAKKLDFERAMELRDILFELKSK